MKALKFMTASLVLLTGSLALAADSGFGIIAEGTPYSTIPASLLSEIPKYQIAFQSYQAAAGVTYGNPLGRHLIVEGVGYELNVTATQLNYSAVTHNVRVLGARGGGHFNIIKRNMFGIGFDVLGGVGQLSGNVVVSRTNSGSTISTTVSALDKWKQATGLSIFPMIHAGPNVTIPITRSLFVTVGAAMDVPGGLVMTTGITVSPSTWCH